MKAALPLLILPILLIGCLDDCRPPVSPSDVPDSVLREAGNGPVAFTVIITTPDGDPRPDAAVIVLWERESRDDTPHVDTLWARSDADGRVIFNLPDGDDVYIVAGMDGWNDEWLGPLNPVDQAKLTLFPDGLSGEISGSIGDRATFGGTGVEWFPHDVVDSMAWVERLDTLEITLNWNNELTAAGDLGIGIGYTSSNYWNQEFQTSLGAHSETWFLDRGDLDEFGITTDEGLRIGPSVSTGQFNVDGLPYTMQWTATFDASHLHPPICEDADFVIHGDAGDGTGQTFSPDSLLMAAGALVLVGGIIAAVVLLQRKSQ